MRKRVRTRGPMVSFESDGEEQRARGFRGLLDRYTEKSYFNFAGSLRAFERARC